jgi:hypothetical protein
VHQHTAPKVWNKYSQKWKCSASYPYFYVHSCICERFIYSGPPILLYCVCGLMVGINKSLADTWIGTQAAQLYLLEYLFWIFGTVHFPVQLSGHIGQRPFVPGTYHTRVALFRSFSLLSLYWVQKIFKPRVDREISFFSSRPNWDSPNLSHAGECVLPLFGSGGGRTRLLERGWGSPNYDEGTDTVW